MICRKQILKVTVSRNMVIDYPLISNRVGVGNEREYQNLVLLEDNQESIPLELLQNISEDELRQFKRLVRIIEKKASYVIVEKNHYHRIGRFKYNNLIITVPPPFDPDLFVDLLLYASSHSLDRYIKHRVAPVNLDRIGSEDLFIYLLVYLFAEILENIALISISSLRSTPSNADANTTLYSIASDAIKL